jgi:3'(2'), 5'-bisphosphate nucleotidase
MGVVCVPVKQEYFWAIRGKQAFWHKDGQEAKAIFIRHIGNVQQDGLRVAVSRRHGSNDRLQELLNKIHNYDLINCGSALKICLIAKGDADLYPRFGKTSEWDTAAGQCILEAAGGKVLDLYGHELSYNTKDSLINPEFVAISSIEIFKQLF